MRLLFVQFSLLMLIATRWGAASKTVEGKLEAAPEGETWILRIGTGAVAVEIDKKTRFLGEAGRGRREGF